MINFGNISIADLRLGATQVQAAYLGNKQVWSIGPVVPKYDIQSIGRSTSEQGTSIEISEQAGETITLYIKTNATDLTNKQVCAAVYLNSTDVTPYASFAFSNVSLTGRYITGTTPDVSTWVPSGFPETYNTLYMKTWIQDTGYIDPADALGEVLDWTGEEPAPIAQPLCFTAITGYGNIRLSKNGSPDAISLEVSRDNIVWNDYTVDTDIEINSSNNNKLYFRAKGQNSTISKDTSNYYYFRVPSSGANFKFEASGNIQTLLKADGSRTDVPAYCYNFMFQNCTSLTTAPELPATTLASYCYQNMFNTCTYLTTAPALPAMTLADHCYQSMFYTCTALTTAPVLPATTLASDCYNGMFYNCQSLTTAPALPATTLANSCYAYMFYNCTSLNSIEVAFTSWPVIFTTNQWVSGVAASGTFTCPAELPDTRGISKIPEGWTKVDLPDVGSTKFKINGAWRTVDIVGELTQADVPSGTLTEVEIGEHVTSLGSDAFREQTDLTAVTMPNTLSSIGSSSFYQTAITDISVPNSVQSIELGAFSGCRQLSSITLGNVATIGVQAFYNCSALTSLTIPSQTTSIGFQTFANCSNLLDMTFTGKTTAQVQGMTNYSWMLPTGCTIHCTDGDITL